MPVTPYKRLHDATSIFVRSVKYARRVVMWTYPKGKVEEGLSWSLRRMRGVTSANGSTVFVVSVSSPAEASQGSEHP